MKKKMIIVVPHLSTGGLPQFVVKKIGLLKDSYEIKCVEYSCISHDFIVQKRRVIDLLGVDNLITLNENKGHLLDVICSFSPDIVWMEEFPEFFVDRKISNLIYSADREYSIIETTHDSSFKPSSKIWMPDKFFFVSPHNALTFYNLGVPFEVIEYPVDKKSQSKEEARIELGLDPEWKHVVNVGLFTPRKNQGYVFEIAKNLTDQKIKFHFLGNRADNFKSYWEPLMNEKPENCVVWGERKDVDTFLDAADLFIFSSRGDRNNKELNPISIKEALSKSLPIAMFDLDVYCGKYKDRDEFYFLSGSAKEDASAVSRILNKDCVIVSAYPVTIDSQNLTIECINSIRKSGFPVILVSHCEVPSSISDLCESCVIDKNNILTYHDFYSRYWANTSDFNVNINIRENNNHIYHGPAVYTNYRNGVREAIKLGYSRCILTNFDFILSKESIEGMLKIMGNNDAVFHMEKKDEGNSLTTAFCAVNPDFFISTFPEVLSENDYTLWKSKVSSESNGLENMFYHSVRVSGREYVELDDLKYKEILSGSSYDICSRVEYLTFLDVSEREDQFAVWYNSSDKILDSSVEIKIEMQGDSEFYRINGNYFYKIFDRKDNVKVSLFKDGLKIREIDSSGMPHGSNGSIFLKYER
jgi:glycosyltransferase involved in cell wall biosynthesis